MDYNEKIQNLLINNSKEIYKLNKTKVIKTIFILLNNEIDNFDFNSSTNITYIFYAFDVLTNNLKNNIQLQNISYDEFISIHNKIKSLLHAAPDTLSKKGIHRYEMLKHIINKEENAILRIYLDSAILYNEDKEEYFHYLLFTLKQINLVENACNKFPYLVNSFDKNGTPIFEKAINCYLEALEKYVNTPNLGPLDDLIYYDKLIQIIFNTNKINIDDYNKTSILKKIYDEYKNNDYISSRQKEKKSFFINNLINIIEKNIAIENISQLSYKYEIHDKFKEAHNMEAKNIYVHKKIDTPINQTRYIYTFDGKDAKEIDDALSITIEDGIYTLGVHIASPSNYIQDNSILIDEAIRRTTSIYLQNDVIPLYPTILSTQLMSLNENQKTYAMSYYFKIDQITGELIDFQIKNEIIQINQNLTYDIFNTILEHGSNDQNLEQTVINLNLISSILKQIYNENAIYKEFHNDKHKNNGMSVIESAMIYTNYNIARLFSERQLPFIYRCHRIDKKITKKLSLLQERLKENNINNQIVTDIEMIKNIFPPAYYALNNQGHFGLGINYYSHSTSPLRRYADNVANKCINKFILNDYTEEDIKLMEEYIQITTEILNNKRYSINTFEEEYKKIKKYQN